MLIPQDVRLNLTKQVYINMICLLFLPTARGNNKHGQIRMYQVNMSWCGGRCSPRLIMGLDLCVATIGQ